MAELIARADTSLSDSEPSVSYSVIGMWSVRIFLTSESVEPGLSDSKTVYSNDLMMDFDFWFDFDSVVGGGGGCCGYGGGDDDGNYDDNNVNMILMTMTMIMMMVMIVRMKMKNINENVLIRIALFFSLVLKDS